MEQTLKIYFTSDVHGYFYPTTYGDLKRKDLGLFSFARDFKKDENTLVIDGGDILQGSAFAYYCRQKSGSPQAIVDIMNDCGYDYYTLGNHDFNYGMDYQNAYIEAHHGACVCQNVVDEAGRACHPYVIHTLGNGLRVGIVGIVTDYVNVWERKENLAGICITDPFEAAKEALLHLKKEVDITLCIYHGGFECDLKTGERLQKTTENVGYRICKELDFDNMRLMAQTVEEALVVQLPGQAQTLAQNLAKFNEQLTALDDSYKKGLSSCQGREVVHIGHLAFGRLAQKYGFTLTALAGTSHDGEHSVRRLAGVVDLIKHHHIQTIFTEETLSPRLAQTVAAETGAQILPLYTVESISKQDFDNHITYIDLMKRNLDNLQRGLKCQA